MEWTRFTKEHPTNYRKFLIYGYIDCDEHSEGSRHYICESYVDDEFEVIGSDPEECGHKIIATHWMFLPKAPK